MDRGTFIALSLLKTALDAGAIGTRIGKAAKNVVSGGASLGRGVAQGVGASAANQELAGLVGGGLTIAAGAEGARRLKRKGDMAYYNWRYGNGGY